MSCRSCSVALLNAAPAPQVALELLVHIRLALEPEPNPMWIEMFNDLPAGVEVWPGIEHPQVSEIGIDGQVEDDLLEAYVAHIRERVQATNIAYHTEVAPNLEEAAEKQRLSWKHKSSGSRKYDAA